MGAPVTYSKNSNLLTVVTADGSKMIVLQGDGTYMTNSIFANHKFVGTFYSEQDDMDSRLTIQFNDGAEITGTLFAYYYDDDYFNFTATYENSILTMTVTSAVNKDFVNKVIVASVSGSTITIVSTTISNPAYTFANNGSATDPTFNG